MRRRNELAGPAEVQRLQRPGPRQSGSPDVVTLLLGGLMRWCSSFGYLQASGQVGGSTRAATVIFLFDFFYVRLCTRS